MAKAIKNYTEAVKELEEILQSLEDSDEVDMDVISEKVKRASVLMKYCKDKLHLLDEELEKVLSETNMD